MREREWRFGSSEEGVLEPLRHCSKHTCTTSCYRAQWVEQEELEDFCRGNILGGKFPEGKRRQL